MEENWGAPGHSQHWLPDTRVMPTCLFQPSQGTLGGTSRATPQPILRIVTSNDSISLQATKLWGDFISISPFIGAWTSGDAQGGWRAPVAKPEETRELPSSREPSREGRAMSKEREGLCFPIQRMLLSGRRGTVTQQMPNIRSNLLSKLSKNAMDYFKRCWVLQH